MNGLTRQVGQFTAKMSDLAVPTQCLDVARMGIIDCLGVLIAGAVEPAPRLVAELVQPTELARFAPEIPSGRSLTPDAAALVNGVSAHVLDYDDVALAGHPSAVLVPAILAEGFACNSSGLDLLKAYIAGYEAWALLDDLEPGSYHDIGFHPTAVSGTISTAVACAYLRGLNETQATNAVAISASLAAGLVANFGTMTKSLHVGRAAQSGVLAAQLALKGYTGSPDVLEHRTGFLMAHTPSARSALKFDGDFALGSHWRIATTGIHIKRYPVCYATHRSIDAILGLIEAHDIKPDDVQEVHVHTGETQYLMLRNHLPQTGLEAKFSMQFAMASALVQKQVGLSQLVDSFVLRADVQKLMKLVKVTTTLELVQDWDQPFCPADRVSIQLKSGQLLESPPVTRPKGSWQHPLSKDELKVKFLDCTKALPDPKTLFDQMWRLSEIKSCREILSNCMSRDLVQV